MHSLDVTQFEAVSRDKHPIFVLGAGASWPFLPTAYNVKSALVRYLLDNSSAPKIGPRRSAVATQLELRINEPHLTLEVLCSFISYRTGVKSGTQNRKFNAAELWRSICAVLPSRFTTYLGTLAKARPGWLGPILTSNFDHMLPDAMQQQNLPYRVVTDRLFRKSKSATQLNGARIVPQSGDIVAFHGTTFGLDDTEDLKRAPHSPPTSALSRGLATPFGPDLDAYITEVLTRDDSPIFFVGYSGSDHYDMNPLLESLVNPPKNAAVPLVPKERLYWLSYDKDVAKNFSDFVRNHLCPDRLFRAKAAELLEAYLRKWHLTEAEQATKLSYAAELRSKFENSWDVRLSDTMAKFGLDANDCDRVIDDLCCNMPAAFAVCEHYYLYSNAYPERITLEFAGLSPDKLTETAPHLRFLDLPFGDLLVGQYLYRCEDEGYKKTPKHLKPSFAYSETKEKFSDTLHCLLARTHSIKCDPKQHIAPEYLASIHVGVAIAYDYLGLISSKRLVALEALSGCYPATAPEATKLAAHIAIARKEALDHYADCVRHAQRAVELLDSIRLEKHNKWLLDQLVQASVWIMIGNENAARATERKASYRKFENVIKARFDAIALAKDLGNPDYDMAHYPQLWLRASELIKKLLDIRSNGQEIATDDALGVDASAKCLLEWANVKLVEAFDAYQDYCTKPQNRFISYYDGRILYEIWRYRHASIFELGEIRQTVARLAGQLEIVKAVAQGDVGWVEAILARVARFQSRCAQP